MKLNYGIKVTIILNFFKRFTFNEKVDNIPYRTTPETLRRAFEKYGDVGDVYIPRDQWVFAIYYNFNNFVWLLLNLLFD